MPPVPMPHSGQCKEERILAADAVAHPSEQECPQRTDQESGGEQRNRAQQSRNRMGLFKELDRQDRGQAAEDIEVIPLDDVSHGCGDDHAPEVLRNLRASHIVLLRISAASIPSRPEVSLDRTAARHASASDFAVPCSACLRTAARSAHEFTTLGSVSPKRSANKGPCLPCSILSIFVLPKYDRNLTLGLWYIRLKYPSDARSKNHKGDRALVAIRKWRTTAAP